MKIFNVIYLVTMLLIMFLIGISSFLIICFVASLMLLYLINANFKVFKFNYFDLFLFITVVLFILLGARFNFKFSYIAGFSYLILTTGFLIMYAKSKEDNFNKIFIVFVIIGLIVGGLLFQVNIIFLLLLLVLCSTAIFILNKVTAEHRVNQLKNSMFIVAKKNLLNNPNTFILVENNNKLIWANDYAYNEFSELKESRDLSFLNITKNAEFKHNNSTYENYYQDGVFFIRNITKFSREIKKFQENALNMSYLKIDNYEFISTQLGYEKFLRFESDFKSKLFNWFLDNNVYYLEIEEDYFQIMYPAGFLAEQIESRFSFFKELVESYQEEDVSVTLSIGVALNQDNVSITGQKATEALELAITRGGGQIVINDADSTNYIGGRVSTIKGRTRIKAKVMGNSLLNVVKSHDIIYLMTHKNPDSDALASMFLVMQLINVKVPGATVKVIIDENISQEQQALVDKLGMPYHNSYVLDQTKSNLLIVLDTQSTDILSDPKSLEQIKDVVVIDHHQTPVNYINNTLFSWIHPSATSTVEMICEILFAQKIKLKNRPLAELAILGIMTDTTNLKYRVEYNTLEILAYLSETGASLNNAITSQYLSQDLFLIKQKALGGIYFINNFSVVEVNDIKDDVILAIIVNAQMEVKNITGALIISYIGDEAIVKFRTSSTVSAKLLMEKYSGGGHHNQAATKINRLRCIDLLNDLENYQGEL